MAGTKLVMHGGALAMASVWDSSLAPTFPSAMGLARTYLCSCVRAVYRDREKAGPWAS